MNSFQRLSELNPFVSPTLFLTQTNEQYNLFGGINGTLSSNISFNLKASYKKDEDHALFVRNNSKSNGEFSSSTSLLGYEYGNSFGVFYDDISTLSIFGELESCCLVKDFHLGGTFQTNSYTTTFQQEAWNLPKIEGVYFWGISKTTTGTPVLICSLLASRMRCSIIMDTFPSTIAGIESLEGFDRHESISEGIILVISLVHLLPSIMFWEPITIATPIIMFLGFRRWQELPISLIFKEAKSLGD